jgi:tetratricopeptide (TPR) repeat protein
MASTTAGDPALSLVHEGWNHLMSQRPLAAWGTWQQALRINPDSAAAKQALSTLESAPDLPLAARKVYRFRAPADARRRAEWDHVLREGGASELSGAATAFHRLSHEAPWDADAHFNLALCHAWSGQHEQAIESLAEVVRLQADEAPEKAIEAWMLAEILRPGGGAEFLADDLRYACTFAWNPEATSRLVDSFPEIRRIPTPRDPTRPDATTSELEVFEWLDSPMPAATVVRSSADLPRLWATIYVTPDSLRLSSPIVEKLELVEEKLRRLLPPEAEPTSRVAAPLPLPFLDADVWTARLPEGIGRERSHELLREVVENHYENEWIHRPRQGLDGLTPLAAALDASRGDSLARVKLQAIVRLREQLGSRPSSLAMYQGYPFDRLRRRLGLELDSAASVDTRDLSCAGRQELEALAPEELGDADLVEAFKSAAGFRDDALTLRFAEEWTRREAPSTTGLDLTSLFAPLARRSIQQHEPEEALALLERARDLGNATSARSFDTWRAEIFARTGRADDAVRLYLQLIEDSDRPAPVALDAAETLLDNNHVDEAIPLLRLASELASDTGPAWVEDEVRRLLKNYS